VNAPDSSWSSPPLLPTDWKRLEPLIDAVLDAAPECRAALVAELTGGDRAEQLELERLVAECERPYPLLERPAGDRFAAVFGDEPTPMPESLAGRYRIVREVGRGGMAIVYLARDLRHGRDVAVKVVRPELAASLGRARFLREIEIAARLRHPHIVPLYDSGEDAFDFTGPGRSEAAKSILYYVMPYEAGHSLRERQQRGALSVAEAISILHDICEALAHAHEHGIVHRDIKPENVLLAGRHAMVSDFGVARAVSEATTEPALGDGGVIFGTPMYMAPEQAANDSLVDHRADIYSVGVLAYELLSAQTAFVEGEWGQPHLPRLPNVAEALTSLRPELPQGLVATVMKCLATKPADRWQSAQEIVAQLDSTAVVASTPTQTRASRLTARVIAIGLGVALLTAVAIVVQSRSGSERRELHLGRASQLTSDPGLEVQPAISPDGRFVAYAAGHSLQMHIAARPVAGGRSIRLTTDSAANEWFPRWSPDGTRISFLSRGGVFVVSALGGAAQMVVPSRPGAIVTSATWSADGREIAYVRGDSLLARSIGSPAVRLIATGPDLHSCTWSPNGALLACVSGNSFYVTVGAISGLGPMFGNLAPSRIVLIPAAGGRLSTVSDSSSLHQSPAWSPNGKTLYFVSNRDGPRDIYSVDIAGSAPANREPARITTGIGAQSIDFSADGAHVVYAAYTSTANVWAMPIRLHAPASLASVVAVTSGNQTVEGVRVSPDGRWLVYDSDLGGNSAIYRTPVGGGEAVRLTRGASDDFRGALSPNGRELLYHSFQAGARQMFLLPLDGAPAQQLTRPPGQHSMGNWSPDGNAITLFDMSRAEILVMRRDQHGHWGAPHFVAKNGVRPEWSPDGSAIAFVSPTDGRISVAPADSGTQRDLYVPSAGEPFAELAIFEPHGRELYFKSHDARGRASFWSVPVAGGRPRLLARFDDPARASNRFEFASDGKRFYFTIEDRQSDIWVADIAKR
jgi:eukaryotic-like serine/threonine-protein kinase